MSGLRGLLHMLGAEVLAPLEHTFDIYCATIHRADAKTIGRVIWKPIKL